MDSARSLLPTAIALADAARTAVLGFFRANADLAENKSLTGYDPVTEADRAAERAMRDVLSRMRPQDGVEGEEYGALPGRSGITWYLDPIDGTRAFLAGLPSWTTLIGAVAEGRAILGLIDQPWLEERYIGLNDQDRCAYLLSRGQRTELAACSSRPLSQAILSTTDPFILRPHERSAFEQVRTQARITRYGLDAYAYARLAAGTIDVVIESGLQSYDVAALIPVVEGAGGRVTDWRGAPARLGGQIIAAGGQAILEEALIPLRGSAEG